MSSVIKLHSIHKHYRRGKQDVSVLQDINLHIEAGEFLTVMGPSGSGKSTLLNIICGIESPTSGVVEIAGQNLGTLTESQAADWRARNVGIVFQNYHLLPALTAAQNVEVPLLLTPLSKQQRRKRAHIALQIVGMDDRASHKPGELSGGQQQRVAIGRAIVVDPSILICDEPTGDLDSENTERVLDTLALLNREMRKTVVMVTHDPLAAKRASRLLYLEKGLLRQHSLKDAP